MSEFHKSVLLKETIHYLKVIAGHKYIDATLGGGGHTFEILRGGGIVLSLDVDNDAIEYVSERIKNKEFGFGNKLSVIRGNFRDIKQIAIENRFEKVYGIVFDLGVSSHQLDTPERGFSFRFNSTLDMRMDKDLQVRALDLLKVLKKGELYEIFKNLGEESYANSIAANIVESRRVKPIESTTDLEEVVRKSVPFGRSKINPSTKVFQALRIAVNDELESLQMGLNGALDLLDFKARIAVISFHSLEDRIIKKTYIDWEKQGKGEIVTNKPVLPNESEIERNPRSRSAKLRVFEKN